MLDNLPNIILFKILILLDVKYILNLSRTNKKLRLKSKAELSKDYFWYEKLKYFYNIDKSEIPINLTVKNFYFSLVSKIASFNPCRPIKKYIFPNMKVNLKLGVEILPYKVSIYFINIKDQIESMNNRYKVIKSIHDFLERKHTFEIYEKIQSYEWLVTENPTKVDADLVMHDYTYWSLNCMAY